MTRNLAPVYLLFITHAFQQFLSSSVRLLSYLMLKYLCDILAEGRFETFSVFSYSNPIHTNGEWSEVTQDDDWNLLRTHIKIISGIISKCIFFRLK